MAWDDRTIPNPGSMLPRARGAQPKFPPFDPSSLNLTMLFRDYPGTTSWTGGSSLGTSGSNNAIQSTAVHQPAVTTLNSKNVASFDGVAAPNQDFFSFTPSGQSNYTNPTSASGWMLTNPGRITVVQYMWYDGTNGPIVSTSLTGNIVYGYNGVNTAVKAMTVSVWQLITWRYDGVNVQVGINEPPGASGGATISAFSTSVNTAGNVAMGDDGSGLAPYQGIVAEVGMSKAVLSDTDFANIKIYANLRYALAL